MNKNITILMATTFVMLAYAAPVHGVSLSVTGNGDGSSNEITVEHETETVIQQSNDGKVSNDVQAEVNTGGNSTTDNKSDEVSITTGDANAQVAAATSLNTSMVANDCCLKEQSSDLTIADNGTESKNTIELETKHKQIIALTQTATIQNTSTITATTGKNSASGNVGDATIRTGSITSEQMIINNGVNSASVHAANSQTSYAITIENNALNSQNTLIIKESSTEETTVNNSAYLINEKSATLTTGENHAVENMGSVLIETGAIIDTTTIENTQINSAAYTLSCCAVFDDPAIGGTIMIPDPLLPDTHSTPPAQAPSTPAGNNGTLGSGSSGNGNGSSNDAGSVLAKAGSVLGDTINGAILPATGSNSWLFATMANGIMFLLGLYLRLRAGRSPNFAYA